MFSIISFSAEKEGTGWRQYQTKQAIEIHQFCVALYGFMNKCCCICRNKNNKVAVTDDKNEKQIVDILFDDDCKRKKTFVQNIIECIYPLSSVRLEHETNRYYMNISKVEEILRRKFR